MISRRSDSESSAIGFFRENLKGPMIWKQSRVRLAMQLRFGSVEGRTRHRDLNSSGFARQSNLRLSPIMKRIPVHHIPSLDLRFARDWRRPDAPFVEKARVGFLHVFKCG